MKGICTPMKAAPVKKRPPGNIFRFNCIVLAHPFMVRDYVKKITLNACVHAVEVFNSGNQPEADVYGLAYVRRFGYPITAGSDMHYIPRKNCTAFCLTNRGRTFSLVFVRFRRRSLLASKQKLAEAKVNFCHWNVLMSSLICRRTA